MKYLAVADHGQTVFLEDNESVVRNAIHRESLDINYYPILIDRETGRPTLGDEVTEENAPRLSIAG